MNGRATAGEGKKSRPRTRSRTRSSTANTARTAVRLKREITGDAKLAGKCVSAVRDAVSNLVLNALQATPSGGHVKLVANTVDGELAISVEDSGTGVPVDLRERIWEPFFTTRQRGTGLGLAIVRKRVQEVGGSASLGASRNGGAVFHLHVPI